MREKWRERGKKRRIKRKGDRFWQIRTKRLLQIIASVPLKCIIFLNGLSCSCLVHIHKASQKAFFNAKWITALTFNSFPWSTEYCPSSLVWQSGPWRSDHCLFLQTHFPLRSPSFPFNTITLPSMQMPVASHICIMLSLLLLTVLYFENCITVSVKPSLILYLLHSSISWHLYTKEEPSPHLFLFCITLLCLLHASIIPYIHLHYLLAKVSKLL